MFPTLLAAFSWLAVAAAPQDDPSALRAVDLKGHIGFLASDELEGRESGERGGRMAGEYFAHHWEKLGLKPIGLDGSYLLPFQFGRRQCFNTAGLLEGTDPRFADQILVIGGHHDHAGIGGPGAMGGPGEIHNGADDNASGSSGVAELAEWFAKRPLRRPILFMTFSAEERGLLGSQDFVANGPLPTSRMHAMINLDMVGRSVDDYLFVGGLGTAKELHAVLDPLLEESKLKIETSDLGEAPSDNTSFYQAGVPALFFFTNVHEDYHLPEDDADKINYEGEVKILELVRDVMVALDRRDAPLSFQEAPGMGMPADFMDRNIKHFERIAQRRENKGKLGIRPGAELDEGLTVGEVSEGSAAAAAGIATGDLLLSVDGKPTRTKEELRRALGGKKKGEDVVLRLRRAGAVLELKVTLQ